MHLQYLIPTSGSYASLRPTHGPCIADQINPTAKAYSHLLYPMNNRAILTSKFNGNANLFHGWVITHRYILVENGQQQTHSCHPVNVHAAAM